MRDPKEWVSDPLAKFYSGLGWTLEEDWPGLFLIWSRRGEYEATLDYELLRRENEIRSGHAEGDDEANELNSMFALMSHIQRLESGPSSLDRDAFAGLSKWFSSLVGEKLFANVGPSLEEIFFAKTETQAIRSAGRASSLFERTLNGLVKRNFPGKTKGSGEPIAKELVAIQHARELCERLRRLPSKVEVRDSMESAGIFFTPTSKDKKQNTKWGSVFDRAGLAALPESPPRQRIGMNGENMSGTS